jgi:hypothetical protein
LNEEVQVVVPIGIDELGAWRVESAQECQLERTAGGIEDREWLD